MQEKGSYRSTSTMTASRELYSHGRVKVLRRLITTMKRPRGIPGTGGLYSTYTSIVVKRLSLGEMYDHAMSGSSPGVDDCSDRNSLLITKQVFVFKNLE